MGCWIAESTPIHYSTTPLLHASRRVTPDECGFTSSDGDPGTNGATSKTRCGTGNQHHKLNFASGHFPAGRDSACPERSRIGADKFEIYGPAELRPTVPQSHPAIHSRRSIPWENA